MKAGPTMEAVLRRKKRPDLHPCSGPFPTQAFPAVEKVTACRVAWGVTLH